MLRIIEHKDLHVPLNLWDTRRMTTSLAIIGAGVRGTAALGRLASRVRGSQENSPREIHVIDPFPPGSGRIWRHDQPRALVMNTVAAQSTVFDDPSLGFSAAQPGPTFAEWCAEVAAGRIEADEPWTRSTARDIRAWSSPPRALYGRYLSWAFARFASMLPETTTLHVHRECALAVEHAASGYEITLANGARIRADGALLALGWLPRVPSSGQDISPDSPIDQNLASLGAGERVAVRGIGMGFTDLLSLVTEERGGEFEADPEAGRPGALRYRRSGAEPVIFAGSRSGLPFLAKPAFGAVPPRAEFPALQAALPELRSRRPLDFAHDVLPLIEHAAAASHYAALAARHPAAFSGDPRELLVHFESTAVHAHRHERDHWRRAAQTLVPDPALRFDPERIGAPLRGRTAATLDRETAARIAQDAHQASLGFGSPQKLGLHVYQAARAAIIPVTEFGGISSDSQASLDRYLSLANLAGSGPPLFRIEQLLALHRAGIVTFLGPRLEIIEAGGRRHARSAQVAEQGVPIDRVVEARLDLPDPLRVEDPLLRSLTDLGLARVWPGSRDRPTLEIAPADSALIGRDGAPVPGLHSVGPLHEELRRFTIIAPIPDAGSTVLREIDSAVSALLAHLSVPANASAASDIPQFKEHV